MLWRVSRSVLAQCNLLRKTSRLALPVLHGDTRASLMRANHASECSPGLTIAALGLANQYHIAPRLLVGTSLLVPTRSRRTVRTAAAIAATARSALGSVLIFTAWQESAARSVTALNAADMHRDLPGGGRLS
jgi:hypothetical protein